MFMFSTASNCSIYGGMIHQFRFAPTTFHSIPTTIRTSLMPLAWETSNQYWKQKLPFSSWQRLQEKQQSWEKSYQQYKDKNPTTDELARFIAKNVIYGAGAFLAA